MIIREELKYCSLCQAERYETVFSRSNMGVVRCTTCQLMRLSPEFPRPVVRVLEHAHHAGGEERYMRQWLMD